MLFMSPLAGWMFDNYGPRPPILIGTILHVLGLMMSSISKEYYQFMLSQSVCSGIGSSLIFTPAMTAVCYEARSTSPDPPSAEASSQVNRKNLD